MIELYRGFYKSSKSTKLSFCLVNSSSRLTYLEIYIFHNETQQSSRLKLLNSGNYLDTQVLAHHKLASRWQDEGSA